MDAAAVLGTGACAPAGDGVVEAAYAAFGPEIQRRLFGLMRDQAAAEDLAQETFLRLHVEVASGRTPDNVRAWLHRVAGNLVTSRGRHAQVAARCAPRLREPEATASTEDLVVRLDGDRRIVAALGELRPADRDILVMAAAGLSGPEIAVRIGRSASATRTVLCRARLHLRERVEALEATA